MENLEKQLAALWEKYASIDNEVLNDRGYLYCRNTEQKDILITGINPSFREGMETKLESASYDFGNCSSDKYWSQIHNMLKSDEYDYTDVAAYLDLFYYRETAQEYLKNIILKHPLGVGFVAEQLRITQWIIEYVIRPKVIIIKNKESYAYWGKLQEKGYIWMGYKFESIGSCQCGEICRISGFIDSDERISPEITQSNLVGSIVLFSKYGRFLKKEERVTADTIKQLLEI